MSWFLWASGTGGQFLSGYFGLHVYLQWNPLVFAPFLLLPASLAVLIPILFLPRFIRLCFWALLTITSISFLLLLHVLLRWQLTSRLRLVGLWLHTFVGYLSRCRPVDCISKITNLAALTRFRSSCPHHLGWSRRFWRRLSVHRGRRRRVLRPRVHLGRRCLHEVTPAAVLAVAPRWGFRSCGWPRALALRAVAARPGAGGPRPADAAVGLSAAVTRARLGLGVGRRLLPRQAVLLGLQQRGARRQQRLHLSGHLRGGAGRAAGPARGRWRGAGARAARTRSGADGLTLSGAPGRRLRRA